MNEDWVSFAKSIFRAAMDGDTLALQIIGAALISLASLLIALALPRRSKASRPTPPRQVLGLLFWLATPLAS